jgi:hypothetical protein
LSEYPKSSYCGLPIPSDHEIIEINSDFLKDNESNINHNLYLAADNVIKRNPTISEIISYDITFFQEFEAIENYTEEQINEYSMGISSGYAFYIGLHTLVSFIRSDYDNMSDYLNFEGDNLIVSGISESEKDRIFTVRNGHALIEKLEDEEFMGDSSDLAFVDAGKYIYESNKIEELFDNEIENIETMLRTEYKDKFDKRILANIEGFKHGVANAIEMYLQIKEERIIRRLET